MYRKKRTFKAAYKQAFTLVELAISLLIMSFITGAVLVGNALTHNSQILAVVNEINLYQTAIKLFQEKYHGLPGDINNATTILPGSAANGDGNGYINTNNEALGAWQQLALAGLIPGKYTGVFVTNYIQKSNVPPSKINDNAYYYPYSNPGVTIYSRTGNLIQLTSGSTSPWGPSMNASDAYAIDLKMDDGLSSSGRFVTYRGTGYTGAGNCVTNDFSSASSSYILTDSIVSCRTASWLDPMN